MRMQERGVETEREEIVEAQGGLPQTERRTHQLAM